jgi:MFS superfamily sulfate permease-like transporter
LGIIEDEEKHSQPIYRNIKRYKNAKLIHGIEIFRFDSFLNFANIDYFRECIADILSDSPSNTDIVLDFSVVSSIDATAIHGLIELNKELKDKNIFFSCMRGPVRDTIRKSGILDHVYKHPFEITCEECATHFHNDIHDVVSYIQKNK